MVVVASGDAHLIELGGEAANDTPFVSGRPEYGYYVFPPAQPGATSFTFHDDDQHVPIAGLVLQVR
jgi:hypothetical protein